MGMTIVKNNSLENACGIYFIKEDRQEDRIKIGKSTNMNDRWGSHQTSNSDELIMIGYILCNEKQLDKFEKAAHNFFEDYNIRGEWFEITVEQVEKYISEQDKGTIKKQKREDNSTKISSLDGWINGTSDGPKSESVIKFRPPCWHCGEKADGWDCAGLNEPMRRIKLKNGMKVPICQRCIKKYNETANYKNDEHRANRYTNGSEESSKNIKKTNKDYRRTKGTGRNKHIRRNDKDKPETNETNNLWNI